MFFFIFLIFLGLSAEKSFQLSACRVSEAGGLRPGGGPSTLGSRDAGDHHSSEVDRFEAWKISGEKSMVPWRSSGGPVHSSSQWLVHGGVSMCLPHFNQYIGQMMYDETWYAKQTPMFFQKSVPVGRIVDARDVTRAAFPEERRPAPNLSGLVKEVFGLPLDKTCQVDGPGPWAMGHGMKPRLR